MVPGVLRAAGDPHGSCSSVSVVMAGVSSTWCWLMVRTVSSWLACWGPPFFRRPDHGCDRGQGQGAVGATVVPAGPGGWKCGGAQRGKWIHPGGSARDRRRRSPWPRPVPSDPGSGRRKERVAPNGETRAARPSGPVDQAVGFALSSVRRPVSSPNMVPTVARGR